ncbi:MAG: GDP-mannose 4,6-dehydratase, partial [Campylobacterales bacterium]|nr:GDP-mannose 4,6-dehydratase [Campylobacterales bacterium]
GYIESINQDRVKELNLDLTHLNIGKEVVAVDKRYFRPTEVDLLLGDPTKAEQKLGWKREFDLRDLVSDMMKNDLKLMTKDVYLKDGGYKIMSYFE